MFITHIHTYTYIIHRWLLQLPPLVTADGADDEEEQQGHQKVRQRHRDEQPEIAGGAALLEALWLGVGALARWVEVVQTL